MNSTHVYGVLLSDPFCFFAGVPPASQYFDVFINFHSVMDDHPRFHGQVYAC